MTPYGVTKKALICENLCHQCRLCEIYNRSGFWHCKCQYPMAPDCKSDATRYAAPTGLIFTPYSLLFTLYTLHFTSYSLHITLYSLKRAGQPEAEAVVAAAGVAPAAIGNAAAPRTAPPATAPAHTARACVRSLWIGLRFAIVCIIPI